VRNLRDEAISHGVDPDRLVFAGRLPLPEHLARHRAADLFLDTVPYNAHTTASDALWAGLPLLTCSMGDAFASRVAASLLTAAGLPELITTSAEDYEQLALRLYRDKSKLAALRDRLAANRLTCALFDTERYARDLETLYAKMIDRHERGLPPDHLFV
jgi:protein O-GlcNAc transferase